MIFVNIWKFFDSNVKSYLEKRTWRKHNSHNLTKRKSFVREQDIQIGNFTYGDLNVEDSSDQYKLIVGNFCSIAKGVTFVLSADHYLNHVSTFPFKNLVLGDSKEEAISKGDIIVDDDVWIGYGATILSGIHIGQGAVVAAGAVVTSDVPPYAIVGGVPAEVIKYRFVPEVIEELLKIDYGKLDKEMISQHIDDLYEELTDIKQLAWMPRKL